jgi:hypothetical protein
MIFDCGPGLRPQQFETQSGVVIFDEATIVDDRLRQNAASDEQRRSHQQEHGK